MTHRGIRPLILVLVVAGAFAVLAASPAQAQEQTGALAEKECPNAVPPDFYTIGETVTCTFAFVNEGAFPATVTLMTETSPVPGGTPVDIGCTLPDGTTVINEGDTLAPDVLCSVSMVFTIPNDPALCPPPGALATLITDRADIELSYPNFTPPLEAGAFATHVLAVLCPPPPTTTTTTTTTTPPTTVPPTTAPPTSVAPPTTAPPVTSPPMLPATGGEETNLALLAGAALAVGVALVFAVRRRARP